MKPVFIIIFVIQLSIHLYSQENKISKMSIPEKWAAEFDKNELDSIYPDSEFKKSPLTGIWVEENVNTDTLIFYPYYDGREPIFYLERGPNNNNNLPKKNSGSYYYRLEDGFIRTQWFLSSLITYNPYFIKISIDSSEMEIGDFYGLSDQNSDTLKFIRVDK